MEELYHEKNDDTDRGRAFQKSVGLSLNMGVNELADVLHRFFLKEVASLLERLTESRYAFVDYVNRTQGLNGMSMRSIEELLGSPDEEYSPDEPEVWIFATVPGCGPSFVEKGKWRNLRLTKRIAIRGERRTTPCERVSRRAPMLSSSVAASS